ncbi:hypothetical protein ACLM5J_17060 [Nocardioides sp. Bht2]|uniref:hypothetical protein n=1 Tax=Nocardioides sp. Bht2 TaxID=3392297 RepID=UPI0039B699E5
MNDHFQDQLGAMLRTRADHADTNPVTFDTVRSTAGRIRRRRIAAAVVTTVGVVGIPATIAVSTLGGDAGSDPTYVAAAPTFSAGSGTAAPPSTLEPGTLEKGADADADLVYDGTLHTADGRALALPEGYSEVHRWHDGWLAINHAGGESSATALMLDADGRSVGEPFETNGFVVSSSDGSQLLLMAGEELRILEANGEVTVVARGLNPMTIPVGIDDAGAVYFNEVDPTTYERDGRVWRDGEITDPTPRAMEPLDAVNGQGFTTRIVKSTVDGECTAVFAPNGTQQARTCDVGPAQFSPDGTAVTYVPAYRSGEGDTQFGILGADWSQPLAAFSNPGSAAGPAPLFRNSVWEDDEHALVLVSEQRAGTLDVTWYVVRVATDGSTELAAKPVTALEGDQVTLGR